MPPAFDDMKLAARAAGEFFLRHAQGARLIFAVLSELHFAVIQPQTGIRGKRVKKFLTADGIRPETGRERRRP